MRTQRRLVTMVAGLATIATMLASCGTSDAAISGKNPSQILGQAFSKISGQRFTFTLGVTFKADLSKVSGFSPSQLGSYGPIATNGLTLNVDGTIESQKRTMLHVKLQPLCSNDIYFAEYDGRAYSSTDGKTWADTGAASSSNKSTDQKSVESGTSKIGFTDKGSTTQDGQTVEDLQLPFDNGLIDKIAAASNAGSSAASIKQFVKINGKAADVYVRPQDGLPESIKSQLNATFDVGQIVALLSVLSPTAVGSLGATPPAGTLGLSLGEDLRFANYGSATVSKPQAGAKAADACPELSGLGGALGGLGNSGSPSSDGSSPIATPDLSGLNSLTSPTP